MSEHKSSGHARNFKDLTGQRFGKLLVVEYAGKRLQPCGKSFVQWRCQCDCGNETIVLAASLKRGQTSSCGCYRAEWSAKNKRTHGKRHTREYCTWASMISRCTNRHNRDYQDYGGRGISVCERWRLSFQAFLEDMGPRPQQCSIERRNNNGNYEPGNCYWATQKTQVRNRRITRRLTFNGVTRSLGEWSEATGMALSVIADRVCRGWTAEEILTHPSSQARSRRSQHHRMITFGGITLCAAEWAERIGIGKDTLHRRLNIYGWSVERALTTPARRITTRQRQ